MSDQELDAGLNPEEGSNSGNDGQQETDARTSGVPSNISVVSGTMETHKMFSLTPASSIGGIIDYSTTKGRKLYASATSKLEDDLFNCTAEDLYGFLRALKDRAREYGWDEPGVGILSIPNDPYNPTGFRSLIDQHGEVNLEEIRRFEVTYIKQQNRSAQDAAQLYRCLMSSLSKEGKKKILVWEEQYMVDGFGSGNLLLKIIVRESHLDTNATSSSIRTKLTDLDRYLPTIGHDIVKFNAYVKLLIDGLKSRGETTQDLLVNLFKGYMICTDKEFVGYIKRKQDQYEEGEQIDPDSLMKKAADKYKSLLQKGTWNAPDANEQKILALQSEIKKLKRKGGKGKSNKKISAQPDGNQSKKPQWFLKRPKSADLKKPKKWKGVNWYYCHKDTGGKCDGVWRQHKPSECKGKQFRRSESASKSKSDKDKNKDNSNNKKRKLQLNQALQANQATVERDEDDNSSSDETSDN